MNAAHCVRCGVSVGPWDDEIIALNMPEGRLCYECAENELKALRADVKSLRAPVKIKNRDNLPTLDECRLLAQIAGKNARKGKPKPKAPFTASAMSFILVAMAEVDRLEAENKALRATTPTTTKDSQP